LVIFKIGSHFMTEPSWTPVLLFVPTHMAGIQTPPYTETC
jgi:hypothetical protein